MSVHRSHPNCLLSGTKSIRLATKWGQFFLIAHLLFTIMFCLSQNVLSQEPPTLAIPKYDETHNFRQDLCERQRQIYTGKIKLEDALENLSLSVVTTAYTGIESYYFSLSEEGTIKKQRPGLFVEVMDALAERGHFTWRKSFGVVGPENPENKSWTDYLLWAVNTYDVSLEYWLQTNDRISKGVAFPEGYVDASVVLVGKKHVQSGGFNLWSFLEPFDWLVWLMIVAAIIYTGLLYYILEVIRQKVLGSNDYEDLRTTVFLSSMGFTGNYDYSPERSSTRLLAFSWAFWAFIMVATYTANLASDLVIQNKNVFQVESIDRAVVLNLPVCVQEGTILDQKYSQRYPQAKLIRKYVEKDVFLGVLKGECNVALAPMFSWKTHRGISDVNVDCQLSQIGPVIETMQAGIASIIDTGVNCSSIIHYALDLHMKFLKSEGVIDRILTDHFNYLSDQSCSYIENFQSKSDSSSEDSESKYRYSINDLGGIFIFHLSIAMLALSIELVRFFYQKYHLNKFLQTYKKPENENDEHAALAKANTLDMKDTEDARNIDENTTMNPDEQITEENSSMSTPN